jgi:hypothetical protein
MELTCLADCGPPAVIIALLLFSAVLAMLAARWKRWRILLTLPALLTALAGLGGAGYDHLPAWWLTITVLGLPLIGLGACRSAPRSGRPNVR